MVGFWCPCAELTWDDQRGDMKWVGTQNPDTPDPLFFFFLDPTAMSHVLLEATAGILNWLMPALVFPVPSSTALRSPCPG